MTSIIVAGLILSGCATPERIVEPESVSAIAAAKKTASDSFQYCLRNAGIPYNLARSGRAASNDAGIAGLATEFYAENECLRASGVPYVSRYDILKHYAVTCCPARTVGSAQQQRLERELERNHSTQL